MTSYIPSLPLPNELIIRVLKGIPVPEIVLYRRISRHMKSLIDETPELQYSLKLYLAGMKEIGTEEQDTAASLTQIQLCLDAQRISSLGKDEIIPNLDNPWMNSQVGYANIIVQQDVQQKTLGFRQVEPKPLWGLPSQWQLKMDLAMAGGICLHVYPQEGLLIVWERVASKAHLLSLLSGRPHPSAQCSVLIPTSPAGHERISPNIAVSEGLLTLTHTSASGWQHELWVYDWKLGILLLNAYHEQPEASETITKATKTDVIQGRYIIVPVLEHYCNGSGRPAIYIYDCSCGTPGRREYRDIPRTATFYPPTLADNAICTHFVVSSRPAGMPQNASQSYAPFYHDPDLQLLEFEMKISKPVLGSTGVAFAQQVVAFDIFVHAGTLAAHCRRAELAGPTPLELAWEDWALRARLLPKHAFETSKPFTHPSHRRCLRIFPYPPRDPNGWNRLSEAMYRVVLHDFPPPAALAQSTVRGPSHWEYVLEPSADVHPGVFQHTVTSGLPYRKLYTGYDAPFTFLRPEPLRFYLAGDCFVGLVPGNSVGRPGHWIVRRF